MENIDKIKCVLIDFEQNEKTLDEAANEILRLFSVVEQSEQLICDTCKSGLIDYPDIYRRTCRCGRLGSTYTNTMLYTGQTVRLTTSDEEHRGKYFKVIEVLDDLVKVEWQKRIYFFYYAELEVVKSCI